MRYLDRPPALLFAPLIAVAPPARATGDAGLALGVHVSGRRARQGRMALENPQSALVADPRVPRESPGA